VLPRFYIGEVMGLDAGGVVTLPDGAARHVQVLRMQPGQTLQLFDGAGQEWAACVAEMGRKHVIVEVVQAAQPPGRELPVSVTLAIGMPANDRMDDLVEKAVELGVHAIQPLVCERSVLRLDGDRALKKVAHWQGVAIAACEQSGRAVLPRIHPIKPLRSWLQGMGKSEADASGRRGVLSLRDAATMRVWLGAGSGHSKGGESPAGNAGQTPPQTITFLSGPEGGLSPAEEQAAVDLGWDAVSLGRRVLRADTAPLAALSVIACAYED
jgi:16S rRNA (uracil1498-N3)-methyltransferase